MTRASREAAEWLARMRGPVTDQDRTAFDAWHARPGNAEAYAGAEADMELAKGFSRERIEAKARSHRNAPGGFRWAIATGAAIALALGGAWYVQSRQDVPQIAAGPMLPGQLRLADGTIVTLMDGAWVNPQLSETERRVVLNGGRARFDVAHDPGRPFIVVAGRSETRAIGTIFEVDAREAVPRIKLIKGVVEVRSSTAGEALRLVPGEIAEVPVSGPRLLPEMANPAPAAWLNANELPLGAVIDAAAKANATPIRLADPALAAVKVTGRFDVTDSRRLARTMAAALDLSVKEQGGEITLSKE